MVDENMLLTMRGAARPGLPGEMSTLVLNILRVDSDDEDY
jgi:hypothetical protein